MTQTATKQQQAQHTPARWYSKPIGNDTQALVIDEITGANVAVIYDPANAPIIEAAPEMLEALNGVLAALSQNATFPADLEYCRNVARAAIAKAEGR